MQLCVGTDQQALQTCVYNYSNKIVLGLLPQCLNIVCCARSANERTAAMATVPMQEKGSLTTKAVHRQRRSRNHTSAQARDYNISFGDIEARAA
jgi:hypothetical protein